MWFSFDWLGARVTERINSGRKAIITPERRQKRSLRIVSICICKVSTRTIHSEINHPMSSADYIPGDIVTTSD
jgi:hypothetical protein